MVTEFFGIINIPESDEIVERIKANLSYKKAHFLNLTRFEDGIAGSVSIGGNCNCVVKHGNIVLLADISIYNKNDLIRQLELPSKNIDDAEFLLKAYYKWGFQIINHFNGDYAFAVWNAQTKELFCARDFPGVRPFYYSQYKNGIIFGSELKFIKALFNNQPELNNDYFLDSLLSLISDKEVTTFKDIYRLPPSYILHFKNRSVKTEIVKNIDPSFKIRFKDNNEYRDCLKDAVFKVIEERCTNTGSLGSELSGGLDSSVIASIASDFTKKNDITFSSFSNTLPDAHHLDIKDEKEFIKKMLSYKNLPWVEVCRTDETIPELIKNSLDIQGCFTQQRFHIFNTGIYKAAAKNDVQVLLSGFGGDEVVSARTGISWNDIIEEKQWGMFFNILKLEKGYADKAIIKGIKRLAKYYFLKSTDRESTSGKLTNDLLNKRFERLAIEKRFSELNQLKRRYFEKHKSKKQFYLSYKQYQKINHPHVPQRLEYSYAAAAQYGIQYRYPLLDKRLIQTFISFPSWVKHQPGRDRYLFREIMENLVPEEIRFRSDKSGFVIPHINQRLLQDKEIIEDNIEKLSNIKKLGEIFDFSRFPAWLNEIIERDKNDINYLMPGAFYNYLMIMFYINNE